ncbi:MAG: hypothetical protein HWE26_06710 [Alteromonadaceae bacterium]|nr:hypothetical protein [Alteromonadaceae bacterium]
MKFSLITTLAFFTVIILGACSSISTSKFAEVDKVTSDFCSRYNSVNEMGKEVKLTTYTINVIETDDSGRKIETSKIVTCDE